MDLEEEAEAEAAVMGETAITMVETEIMAVAEEAAVEVVVLVIQGSISFSSILVV